MAAIASLSLIAVAPAAGTTGSHHKRHHHHTHLKRHHRRRHHHHHHHGAAAHAQAASSPTPTSPAAAPAPAACTNVDTPAGAAPASTLDAAVVCLINQQRVAHGLPGLVANSKLDASAQSWTTWMVANGQFTHGSNFADRISAVGYDWQTAGENIATGFATPTQVVTAWMASPDHCRNILDPDFRDVGTAMVDAPVAGWASGPATWTQDFGLDMYVAAPSSNTGPENGCPYSG